MSTSLSIKFDPIEQKAAKDPLEAATWGKLQIDIGTRNVTRVWDKTQSAMRPHVYVPVFAIAEWIVENWWNILNEPSRTERVPKPSAIRKHLPWVKRHCVRSSDSALLLPKLYFYNDGQNIVATWEADDPYALPHMPAYYLEYGQEFLSCQEVEEALTQFVNQVINRVQGIGDGRVDQLEAQWQAITSADAEETSFCIAAARMGLHPYDPTETTGEIAEAICGLSGDPDLPINRDLTESAKPDVFAEQLQWVKKTSHDWHLNSIPEAVQQRISVPGHNKNGKPHEYGYSMARSIRDYMNFASSAPIASVPDVALKLSGASISMKDHNHLPGQGIQGIVGWTDNNDAVVVGPDSGREASQRFLLARGLFHALYSCSVSQRLVTQAITWDQRASRAFAAELLAPQEALAAQTGDLANVTQVERLAKQFNVSTWVVELQLQNVDIVIGD